MGKGKKRTDFEEVHVVIAGGQVKVDAGGLAPVAGAVAGGGGYG